jgi:hypothetical protein
MESVSLNTTKLGINRHRDQSFLFGGKTNVKK